MSTREDLMYEADRDASVEAWHEREHVDPADSDLECTPCEVRHERDHNDDLVDGCQWCALAVQDHEQHQRAMDPDGCVCCWLEQCDDQDTRGAA